MARSNFRELQEINRKLDAILFQLRMIRFLLMILVAIAAVAALLYSIPVLVIAVAVFLGTLIFIRGVSWSLEWLGDWYSRQVHGPPGSETTPGDASS